MAVPRPLIELLYHFYCEYDAHGVMLSFAKSDLQPTPGLATNFIGLKVPPKIHPPDLNKLAGKIEPPPDPGNWHADIAEWGAALLSVVRAKDTYRIIELGCGWGCWLANMGMAARSRGLSVELIGIEGDRNHLANAAEVLALNGFGPETYTLHHGVAAAKPGHAIFPNPAAGTAEWGGQAIFHPGWAQLRRARRDPSVQVLPCRTLDDLSGGEPVDLLHIDIQGAEAEYVPGNLAAMTRHVRRVLIGTHSRVIEGQLMACLLEAGWVLEMERPALTPLHAGRPVNRVDGVQMWSNPALTAHERG